MIHAFILGIVEGITEFLPISSTFHQIFTAHLLGLPQNDFISLFEVFIQSGAIFAVLLLYFTHVVKDTQLLKKIFISFIPTAVIGFLLHKVIKTVFFQAEFSMLIIFISVGVLFIVLEWLIARKYIKLSKDTKQITIKTALIIGLVQALAVFPGVSRAGAVIIGMMVLGYKREDATLYSFLLAVPTILAASALDFVKSYRVITFYSDGWLLLLVGTAAAFISAYIVVRWLVKYLQYHSFTVFGWYRIILGILLFLIFWKR